MKLLVAFARTAAIIGAVGVVVVGATLALDGNAPHGILSANEVSAASADLQVGPDANNLSNSFPGFKFNNMIPGHTSDAFSFTLKNNGLVSLAVTARIPTDLTGSSLPPDKVVLKIDNSSNGGNIGPTIADLVAGDQPLAFGTLSPGQVKNFIIHATMSPTLTGQGPFSLKPFDLVFTGTQP